MHSVAPVPEPATPLDLSRRHALQQATAAAVVVTAAAALAMRALPPSWRGTAVGGIFLAATYVLVWRHDDKTVTLSGLGLGGLVARNDADEGGSFVRGASRALLWSGIAAIVTFVPFYFGWKLVWHPPRAFVLPAAAWIGRTALGQLIGVALPEEAFYRGFLQSRLSVALPPRRRLVGAPFGVAVILTSAIFAAGHVATVPYVARLAVFFPSLLFGWLRNKTGGIGAPMLFHALCNTLSETLGTGFGLY